MGKLNSNWQLYVTRLAARAGTTLEQSHRDASKKLMRDLAALRGNQPSEP